MVAEGLLYEHEADRLAEEVISTAQQVDAHRAGTGQVPLPGRADQAVNDGLAFRLWQQWVDHPGATLQNWRDTLPAPEKQRWLRFAYRCVAHNVMPSRYEIKIDGDQADPKMLMAAGFRQALVRLRAMINHLLATAQDHGLDPGLVRSVAAVDTLIQLGIDSDEGLAAAESEDVALVSKPDGPT
jgi:hypothetical protein